MTELLAFLAPILAVDALNPILFALLVFAAGSAKPVANSSALLLGHTLAYFLAGIALSFGIEQVAERLANPKSIDFVISGIIGALLLWVTLKTKKDGPPAADDPEWELTPIRCFAFGAVVNFIGLPFALPYFAAVDRIMQADLSTADFLLVLSAYNIGYMLIFAIVPAAMAIVGDKAKPFLEKINHFLVKASDVAMPWMIFLLGAALFADAVMYFWRGEGLL
jgi:cytochrome c biogenesis protein CcdA